MKHPQRGKLDTIIFNEDIVISDIPERAYEYVVNGKPAIEWIIDQYQVKKDKKSGIFVTLTSFQTIQNIFSISYYPLSMYLCKQLI